MKIIGYSERGAMNALFYEMAFKNDKNGMIEFLKLAGIYDDFSDFDFKIYNEFSLSEFGSPDLVIIAEKGNEKVAFFVEAKVAACDGFKIVTAIKEYEKVNPDTSNLFYQLKQKVDFFEIRKELPGQDKLVESGKGQKSIGNNPVVRKFVELLKNCSKAEYIAIIPEVSTEDNQWGEKNPIENLRIIYWEKIYCQFGINLGYESLKETIKFNQGIDIKIRSEERIKSQILNTPIKE